MADEDSKKARPPETPHTITLDGNIIVLTGPDTGHLDIGIDEFWNDPKLAQGYEQLYLQAYYELCEPVTGQKPTSNIPDESDFKRQVIEFIQVKHIDLYYAICIEFDYCEKRKAITAWGFNRTISAIVNLTAILSGAGLGLGVATAVWALSTDLLDKLCRCETG